MMVMVALSSCACHLGGEGIQQSSDQGLGPWDVWTEACPQGTPGSVGLTGQAAGPFNTTAAGLPYRQKGKGAVMNLLAGHHRCCCVPSTQLG